MIKEDFKQEILAADVLQISGDFNYKLKRGNYQATWNTIEKWIDNSYDEKLDPELDGYDFGKVDKANKKKTEEQKLMESVAIIGGNVL